MIPEEKFKYLLNDMAQRGIGKYTAAPPLHRMLWHFGFDVAPPLFASFWLNALVVGVPFTVLWGLAMWLWEEPSLAYTIADSVVTGILFGLIMATYFRWRRQKLALPRWEDYGRGP